MAWLLNQNKSAKVLDQVKDAEPARQTCLTMYKELPQEEVTIEEFERFAVDRLRVLKGIELAKSRGTLGPQLHPEIKALVDKHLKGADKRETVRKDAISHFVLRLAYCRTEELRRWFLMQEAELFRTRFQEELSDVQVRLMRSEGMEYEAVGRAELEADEALRNDLAAVQLSRNDVTGFNAIRTSSQDVVFFKVPFERVPDLVATRKVLLRRGTAYVPKQDIASLVVGHFRATLSKALVTTARRWASVLAHEEADRLTPLVESLSTRHLGEVYNDAKTQGRQIDMSLIPKLAQQSFPLCMQNLYEHLHKDHHLRHFGRQQFGLFLKGLGLPLEQALAFWRTEFGPRLTQPDEFEKKYAYNIRHNYGKAGKMTDYTPHSCVKIISTMPGVGDHHGCPYKTFDADSLRAALTRLRVEPAKVGEALAKARGGHYQLACASAFEGAHGCACLTGINHPNQYFDESRKVLEPQAQAGAATTPQPAQHSLAAAPAANTAASASSHGSPAAGHGTPGSSEAAQTPGPAADRPHLPALSRLNPEHRAPASAPPKLGALA